MSRSAENRAVGSTHNDSTPGSLYLGQDREQGWGSIPKACSLNFAGTAMAKRRTSMPDRPLRAAWRGENSLRTRISCQATCSIQVVF